MHAFDWPKYTQNLHAILYVISMSVIITIVMTCADCAVLTNHLGDIFLSFLPHLSLEEGI